MTENERQEFNIRKQKAVEKLMAKYGLVQEGTKSVLKSFYRERWNDIPEGFTWQTENINDDGNPSLVSVLKEFESKGTVVKDCGFSQIGYGRPYWISKIKDGQVDVHTETGALDGDTWFIRCK